MTSTNRTLKVTLGTVRKSTEQILCMWFLMKVRHVCEGGFGGLLGMRLETVLWHILKPSFINSPWILGAPQRGLDCAILRTRSLISGAMPGLPFVKARDFHLQKALNPVLCH